MAPISSICNVFMGFLCAALWDIIVLPTSDLYSGGSRALTREVFKISDRGFQSRTSGYPNWKFCQHSLFYIWWHFLELGVGFQKHPEIMLSPFSITNLNNLYSYMTEFMEILFPSEKSDMDYFENLSNWVCLQSQTLNSY